MWTHLAERERSQMTTQYGARALHAEQLELQKRTHNMELLLLFLDSSGFAYAPECYVIRTSPLLFLLLSQL